MGRSFLLDPGTEGETASAAIIRRPCQKMTANAPGVARFLRRRHPRATAQCVSAETGISAGTVENWLLGKTRPTGEHLACLVSAYGPALLAAAYATPPDWVGRAVRSERAAEIARGIALLEEERRLLTRSAGRARRP